MNELKTLWLKIPQRFLIDKAQALLLRPRRITIYCCYEKMVRFIFYKKILKRRYDQA